jgi:LysR family transcriptional regulator, regulator for metE and metH
MNQAKRFNGNMNPAHNGPMLELRHLRTLLAIADAGRMSAAAERVHLTQSALSHQVKLLESRYGALFERSRTGLRFTAAGARLLEVAQRVVREVADAERDIARLGDTGAGELRIALECHTCFDWLMPVMNAFRARWPEVELDLVAGFHSEPLALLGQGKADMVIGSKPAGHRSLAATPLFRFEILAVLPADHPLRSRAFLKASDFAGETLVTYPVPEERIDLIREVLKPGRIPFKRRTAELTVALLQLVASGRGIGALPSWGLQNYVEHGFVCAKRIGRGGLHADLFAIGAKPFMARPFAQEFVSLIREQCAATLSDIRLL